PPLLSFPTRRSSDLTWCEPPTGEPYRPHPVQPEAAPVCPVHVETDQVPAPPGHHQLHRLHRALARTPCRVHVLQLGPHLVPASLDRKSTRLNSSHVS